MPMICYPCSCPVGWCPLSNYLRRIQRCLWQVLWLGEWCHMFWTKEMNFFYVLFVCFSCNCILCSLSRMAMPAVWPWVIFATISNRDMWSKGECMSCKWCFPLRMEMPAACVVALGERWASARRHQAMLGHALHTARIYAQYIILHSILY